MAEYVVYALTDPRDEKVRYVGISNNVIRRYREHTRNIDGTTPKGQWIYELYCAGYEPGLSILAIAENEKEARQKEVHLITHYSKHDLFNFIHNTANIDGGFRLDDPELEAFVLEALTKGGAL